MQWNGCFKQHVQLQASNLFIRVIDPLILDVFHSFVFGFVHSLIVSIFYPCVVHIGDDYLPIALRNMRSAAY